MLYILLQLHAAAAIGLFNKPALLFVLDASRCLFKYLRISICYGVTEAPCESGGVARLTEWVRNGSEGLSRGLRVFKVLSCPFMSTSLHTLHPCT